MLTQQVRGAGGAPRYTIAGLALALLAATAACGPAAVTAPPAEGAVAPVRPLVNRVVDTAFEPASVELPDVGSSATVAVAVEGLHASTNGIQVGIAHDAAFAISEPVCTDALAGAVATAPAPRPYGTLLACLLLPPATVNGSAGQMLTFTLTRMGAEGGEVSLEESDTMYARADGGVDGPSGAARLQVRAAR